MGARPDFNDRGADADALKARQNVVQHLVHTGQHYDTNISDVFFEQLGIPALDVNLALGSGKALSLAGNLYSDLALASTVTA